MANVKITELTALTNPASTDVLAIVDIPADTTKKVTIADLLENAGDGTAAAPAFAFNSDTNSGIFLDAADKIGISTNGVGRLYIDSSGNIGIGNSSPSSVLDVTGAAAISGALTAGSAVVTGSLTQGGNNVVTVGDTGTVTSTMILDGTIVNADINASAAIAPSKIGSGALPSGVTVASANIVDGTIVNADVSTTAEIAVSKLANGTARQLLQTDAAGTGVEFASNIDVPGTLDVTSAATFDSNVTVQGNLTVNGTTTTIDSTTLVVEDKNIEMGAVTTPTDTTADGGGITLKGATDKTINWVNSTDAWTLSEHINIANAKEYRINGTKVLDATSLGSAVVGSSLTSVGTIATGVWNGTPIATAYIADNAVTSDKIVDGAIVNADVNASAAIAGTKISPDFGSQAITTTGIINANGKVSFPLGSESAPSLLPGSDTNTGIFSPGADSLAITTAGTQRVVVDSTGNVGIGTSSPSQLLEVSGSALSTTFQGEVLAAGTTERLRLGYRTGGPNTGLTCGQIVEDTNTLHIAGRDTANGDIIFHSGSGIPEVMRIDASNGNVGIGTSTDLNQKLCVEGASNDTIDETKGTAKFEASGGNGLLFGTKASNPFGSYIQSAYVQDTSTAQYSLLLNPLGGNVGIGTTSPTRNLVVNSTSNAFISVRGSNTGFAGILLGDQTSDTPGQISYSNNVDSMQFLTAASEKMRITSGGNVGIGTSSPSTKLHVSGDSFTSGNSYFKSTNGSGMSGGTVTGKFIQGSDGNLISCRAVTTGATHQTFVNSNGIIGSITTVSSTTSFNTSSDYRLKENIVDLDGAIDRVKQLAPKQFNFIVDADKTVDGFIAHEAQAVVPEAVTGSKDEVDDDGNAVMQGIDQSKLVPLLTAALQEAIAKIETLEQRLSDAGIA